MKLTFCLEQTLGHRAHTHNIERAIAGVDACVDVVRVDYRERGRLPLPWTIRASLDARKAMRARPRPDVAFFHTQTVGLFASQAARGARFVVSLDATPHQMDAVGEWYRHRRGPATVEAAKDALYRRMFRGAAAVVAWSDWTADSLVRDYRVAPGKIHVVHPGAAPELFAICRPPSPNPVPRILLVGGDFERKGGDLLLRAFERLGGRAQLTIVSSAAIRPAPNVEVIADATPGCARLLDAYARADIFCLPTRADCTSVAVEEAMAAGLAVITTTVGSNPTTLSHDDSGVLVAPGDEEALFSALAGLVEDGATRLRLGAAARAIARDRYDARENARRLVKLMESVA